MSLIKRLKQGLGTRKPVSFDSPLAPDTPFYVIGDIHGELALLQDALMRIERDDPNGTLPLICVGDYVDRGPDSSDVLRLLHHLSSAHTRPVICLKGNHEAMLISYLRDPMAAARGWFINGGDSTMDSFAIPLLRPNLVGPEVVEMRDQLLYHMGEDLLRWLRDLPDYWHSGNVFVTHAGADPHRALNAQDPDVLNWGHADFQTTPRADGQWVVHGHTIVAEVTAQDGRIAVDTGAYKTGQLSVVRISAQGVDVLPETAAP